jgi:uncharacterized protein (TIGR02996 family)
MTDRAALRRAVAANPDDDTPRLIYADLLDELGGAANAARARFIRLQIETHRARAAPDGAWLPEPDEAFERKRSEEAVLAKRYRREWLGELPTWCNPAFGLVGRTPAELFSRGFVERVTVKAKTFALRAGQLFDALPVRALDLEGGAAKLVPAVFGRPELARLRVLALRWANAADEVAEALAECPWLADLEELDLRECDFGVLGSVS